MRFLFVFLFHFVFIFQCAAQSDTVFVNELGTYVSREQANYYRVILSTETNAYLFNDYFFNHQLAQSARLCRFGAVQRAEYDVDGDIPTACYIEHISGRATGQTRFARAIQHHHHAFNGHPWGRTDSASHLVTAPYLGDSTISIWRPSIRGWASIFAVSVVSA